MLKQLDHIYHDFDKSVNWNAYLYLIQKSTTVLLTFIFFKTLSQNDFSVWANLNSIVYLILLWIDFGFRKSVPKYIAKLERNKSEHLYFTQFIIKFQFFTTFVGLLFLISYLNNFSNLLGLSLNKQTLIYAYLIFLLESPIALIKLIYHAHFWNKSFNLIYSSVMLVEAIVLFILFLNEKITINNIFFLKIISCTVVTIISVYYLIKLYKEKIYLEKHSYNITNIKKSFLKHTSIMWFNTCFRSLGERNFLLPLLTFYFGTQTANIFKIANDWALFFQRSILKTIGTTDTSLFAHTNIIEKKLAQDAFNKIISKILGVCLPLFGILIFIIVNKNYFMGTNQMIFQIFIILITLYIIECLLSPFERILEVNKKYLILTISYISYIFFILIIYLTSIGFWTFIILLCSVKFLSALFLATCCKRIYKINFQFRNQFKNLIVKFRYKLLSKSTLN